MSGKASILDDLRRIFPQINDLLLSDAISSVEKEVGNAPDAAILHRCVNMLLEEHNQTLNEMNNTFVTSLLRNDMVVSRFADPNNALSAFDTATPFLSYTRNAGKTVRDRDTKRHLSFREEDTLSTAVNVTSPTPTSTAKSYPSGDAQTVRVEPTLDPRKQLLKNLQDIFPDAEDDYLQTLVDTCSSAPEAVNSACVELLDTRRYPTRQSCTLTTPSATDPKCELLEKKDDRKSSSLKSPGEAQKEKDDMKDFSRVVSRKNGEQRYQKLEKEFRTIPIKYIKIAFSKCKGRYKQTRKYLEEQLRVSSATATSTTTSAPQIPLTVDLTHSTDDPGLDNPPKIPLLKRKRPPAQEDRMSANPYKKALNQIPSHKQPERCIKKGIPTDDELEELSNSISENWMRLGRRLEISQEELDGVDHRRQDFNEKAFRMLKCWKQKNSSTATYQELYNALCHKFVNRRDLAEAICFR